jgi:hypothetical protein
MLFTAAARFQSWLDPEATLAGRGRSWASFPEVRRRQAKGPTLAELARCYNVSHSTISRLTVR